MGTKVTIAGALFCSCPCLSFVRRQTRSCARGPADGEWDIQDENRGVVFSFIPPFLSSCPLWPPSRQEPEAQFFLYLFTFVMAQGYEGIRAWEGGWRISFSLLIFLSIVACSRARRRTNKSCPGDSGPFIPPPSPFSLYFSHAPGPRRGDQHGPKGRSGGVCCPPPLFSSSVLLLKGR